jgi:DHA1 family multidrug resistance protein-like MFS transporter
MLWSPISEVPQIGRLPVYLSTWVIYVALQIPTALSVNIAMLLVFRFLTGLFGSPCLAVGLSSLTDIWRPQKLGYSLAVWDLATVFGPLLGAVIGGFVSQAKGWRWTIWVLMAAAGGVLAIIVLTLPETHAGNILYRRSRRLRAITGKNELKCEAEISAARNSMGKAAWETLIRPFILAFSEPIVFLLDLYLALSYALFYMWLESFPLVFEGVYQLDSGISGLAYLGIMVGSLVVCAAYCLYHYLYEEGQFSPEGHIEPEQRLIPAMFGAFWIPICFFWFGWTSRSDVHWIVPILGSSTFAIADFLLYVSREFDFKACLLTM